MADDTKPVPGESKTGPIPGSNVKDLSQPPRGQANQPVQAGAAEVQPSQAELINATLERFSAAMPTHKPVGPTPNLDKSVKGGKYMVRGRLVDAHDREINEDGTLKYPDQQTIDAFGRLL